MSACRASSSSSTAGAAAAGAVAAGAGAAPAHSSLLDGPTVGLSAPTATAASNITAAGSSSSSSEVSDGAGSSPRNSAQNGSQNGSHPTGKSTSILPASTTSAAAPGVSQNMNNSAI